MNPTIAEIPDSIPNTRNLVREFNQAYRAWCKRRGLPESETPYQRISFGRGTKKPRKSG